MHHYNGCRTQLLAWSLSSANASTCQPSSAPLVASPLASPVQAALTHALHLSQKVSGLLSNIVRPVDLILRSSSTTNFAMPQLWTKYEEHTFSHAGPAMWNALLEDMHAISDSVVFRKRLKMHFLWPPYVTDADIIFLPSFFFFSA